MKTCALFGICLFVTSVSLAQNHWVSNVTAAANGSYIESFSYAERVDDDGNDAYGYIQGNHCIDYSDISASHYASYCESFDVFHRAYSAARATAWRKVRRRAFCRHHVTSTFIKKLTDRPRWSQVPAIINAGQHSR